MTRMVQAVEFTAAWAVVRAFGECLRRYDGFQVLVKRISLFALIALLAVGAAYANSFENAFHFDDFHTVVDNPAVRSLGNVPQFFTDATTFSVLPANRTYRPVVSASLALDYGMGHGYKPVWFHTSTFVVFVALLALLWLLYAQVMESVEPGEASCFWAMGAAAGFGLHPAMAETVNYVIQRGDIFCTIGCVGALVMWARLPRARKTGLYLLPLAFALLSKPPAAVFPAVLLFYVFFFETEGGARERWRRSLVAIVPSLVVTAALMLFESHMTPKTFLPTIIPPMDYRMTQPYVWLRYFGALILPLHLNVDTDLQAFNSVNVQVIAGFVLVAELAVAIFITTQRKKLYPIAFGLIWFVVTQLPTSLYPLSEVENDHRMFFSFVGLMLAVMWCLRLAAERWLRGESHVRLRAIALGCALMALCGYAWGVHVRNRVWQSEDSLWLDDVKKSPHNGRGLMIYGVALMKGGNFPEALDDFQKALVYTPQYPTLEINLGVVNGAMGREQQAEQHFLRAIALAPTNDTTHTYYGRWLMECGRTGDALTQLRLAIELNPSRQMQQDLLQAALQDHTEGQQTSANADVDALINRSLALNRQGRYQESITAAQQALKIDPNSAIAWNNIAASDEELHRWDDAIHAAQKAIELKPDFQLAKNNLAWSEQQRRLAQRGKQ